MRDFHPRLVAAAAIGVAIAILGTSVASAQPVNEICGDLRRQAEAVSAPKGKTWPQFLAWCGAELEAGNAAAPVEPASAPMMVATSAPTNSQAPSRGSKTARECYTEYVVNKAAIEASGWTKRDFVATCRSGAETILAASTAAPASSESEPAPAPTPPPAQSGSLPALTEATPTNRVATASIQWVPLDRAALTKLYAGKTWKWKNGAAYFGPDGHFKAWARSGNQLSEGLGTWEAGDDGVMCFEASWRTAPSNPDEASAAAVKTCFEHEGWSGAVAQRRLPDGNWYLFRHSKPNKADEVLKLQPGDHVRPPS